MDASVAAYREEVVKTPPHGEGLADDGYEDRVGGEHLGELLRKAPATSVNE